MKTGVRIGEKKFWNSENWGSKGRNFITTLHLHSYCRQFFQSWVYNPNFAEIRPHSCELATHVICGSVVTQLCSETLKLRLNENEASQPRNLKKKPGGRAFCSWPMLCCLLTYSPITTRIYWKGGIDRLLRQWRKRTGYANRITALCRLSFMTYNKKQNNV